MNTDQPARPAWADESPDALSTVVVAQLRILILAGIPAGVVLVGIGSRVAMLALRLTSPDFVIGLQSDDDFTIGEVTVFGTYNLLMLGAAIGIIGVAVYQAVTPWLIGPNWFHRFTTGAAAGAVGGSILVHADGIDFRVLQPTWFAISLFVLLPAVFGAAIGPVVDRVTTSVHRTAGARGAKRWILPALLVLAFPFSAFVLGFAMAVFTIWALLCDAGVPRLTSGVVGGLVVRTCWLGVAMLGLLALVGDIRELT